MIHLKNQNGSALVVVIILLAIVSILGLAMMYSVTSEVKLNKAIEERVIAKYLAQAGIDHALYLIENDDGTMAYPYSKEVVLEAGTRVYEMNISKDVDNIVINSIGKAEKDGIIKQQASLQAIIDKNGKVVIQ